jgi:hypothetical protein
MNETTKQQIESLHNKLSDLVEEAAELAKAPETMQKHVGIILVAADMVEAWVLVCELEPTQTNKAIRDSLRASLMRGAAKA